MRGASPGLTEAQTLERYRYLVSTAPAEVLAAAHRQAFTGLGLEHRIQIVSLLNARLPPVERVPHHASNDPAVFSRAATRAEIREPSILEAALPLGAGGLQGSLFGSVVESLLRAEAARNLLGVFDEEDPVDVEEMRTADPCSDGSFGADAECAESGGEESF